MNKHYLYMYTNVVKHCNCQSQDNFSTLNITLKKHCMLNNFSRLFIFLRTSSLCMPFLHVSDIVESKMQYFFLYMNFNLKVWVMTYHFHVPQKKLLKFTFEPGNNFDLWYWCMVNLTQKRSGVLLSFEKLIILHYSLCQAASPSIE